MRKLLIAALACFVWATAQAQDFSNNRVGPGQPTPQKGGTTINVLNAGLICDNSTDNASVVTKLNALSVAHTTLFFPPVSQACLTSVAFSPAGDNVTYYAYENSVTIKPTTGSVANPVLFSINTRTNIFVWGLVIDGGGQDFGTANNVSTVFTSTAAIFDHVHFQHTRGIAALFSQDNTSGVRDSTFVDIGNHWKTTGVSTDRQQAIGICCGTVSANVGNFALRNYFTDIGLDSISMGTSTNAMIVDNRCELFNNQVVLLPTVDYAACVYVTSSNGAIVANNYSYGASGNAFDLHTSSNLELTGNYATHSGSTGFGIFGISTIAVVGNVSVDNQQASTAFFKGGFSIATSVSNLSMSGNVATDDQVTKTQSYGLQVISGTIFSGDIRIDTSNAFGGNLISNFVGVPNGYGMDGTSDNRVRNPCGAIDQNKEGGTYTAGGGNTFVVDGYEVTQSNGSFSTARGTSLGLGTFGCTTSLHLVVVTSRTAAVGDFYQIYQSLEGVDLQDLNWGSPNAKSIVVDFCMQSSIAGTFPFVLKNSNGPRYYATTYTAAANTLTCNSIVIPGDTNTIITNNTSGALQLTFDMGAGSNNLTSITNVWTSGGVVGVVGETAFVAQTAGATFDITAIRLYAGRADVPWSPRSYGEELTKLRRYYQKSFAAGTAVAQNAGATGSIGVTAPYAQATFGTVSVPVTFAPMRVAPTVVFYSPTAASANCYDTTRAADAGAAAATNIGTNSLTATCTLAAGDLLGDLLNVHYTLDARL